MPDVLALIPARSGSQTIKHKNIREVAGRPLIAHSIEHGHAAKTVNRVIVTTDSETYATIAREFGAEVPFLRPAKVSHDTATDFETFHHALTWLRDHEGYTPDIVVQLRPTYPIRNPADIDHMVQILLDNPQLDSVRTVAPAPHTPFKMWFRNADGTLRPALEADGLPEAYNLPRQLLPQVMMQNACIDVVRARVILKDHSMTGQAIYGYVMDHIYDIDTEAELEIARLALEQTGEAKKTFVFDIDGVIATITPQNDYNRAQPRTEVIRVINRLYDAGHNIVLFTARGYVTGIDWSDVTKQQMQNWGVQYQQLLFGKPAADYYIDDKMMSLKAIENLSSHANLLDDETQTHKKSED